jgi:hypothetical protein
MLIRRVVIGLLFLAAAALISTIGVAYQHSTTTASTFITTSEKVGFEGNWGWVIFILAGIFVVTFAFGFAFGPAHFLEKGQSKIKSE